MYSAEWLDEKARGQISRAFKEKAREKAFRERNKYSTTAYAPVTHEWVVLKNLTTGEYRLQYNIGPHNLPTGWGVLDHEHNAPERFPVGQRVALDTEPNPWNRV